MRNSLTRNTIITLLQKNPTPLAVSELLTKIQANKTTVYRELDFLISQGLVNELEFGDGKKRYELTEKGHHHHLVCTNCGDIECVEVTADLSKQEQEFMKKNNFSVTSHTLEFFGTCVNCTIRVK